MSNLLPEPMPKDALLEVLRHITASIEADDSFEGFFTYSLPEPEDPPGTEFRLAAMYRIGNSMGQGGYQMIGTPAPYKAPES